MQNPSERKIKFVVESHVSVIYPEKDVAAISSRLLEIMDLNEECSLAPLHEGSWDETDNFLITYGDTISTQDEAPLKTLKDFYQARLADVVSGVHVLPFFPYSSDDGFSVIDYKKVNDSLGTWDDISSLAEQCNLMSDLVINHCSSRGRWFENFKQRKHPGLDYFYEASLDDDLSKVVRPRTSPLLREVETLDGTRHVWCTFSHDQIDLNFSNPSVLCEMVDIVKFYLDRGVRTFRLDAVAFLWKEVGGTSLNHPKTHEIIRLLRSLIGAYSKDAILITETNLPNHENLSYFGNANEAHAVYNFALPPLLLHAMLTGNAEHLKRWQMSMPPAQLGTFYFNFLASHDGIGLRPVEGLLSEDDIGTLVNSVQRFGGRVSWRSTSAGKDKPYELNITYFDAMQGTSSGPDHWQIKRFLCAHGIMMALEGVPAIYLQSFLACNNNIEGVELSNRNRTINRFRWQKNMLNVLLDDESSNQAKVLYGLKNMLRLRIAQSAFHPNATQFTLHLAKEIFGFWRQSLRRDQSIFCIYNISNKKVSIPLSSINLISLQTWTDLISGAQFDDLEQDLELEPYQFVWLSNKSEV